MPRRDGTLPAAFSLLNSEFNDFLFAPIGDEPNHASLTVLSALSREGLDPWSEAADWSQQPRDIAARRLASIIAALPDGDWSGADSLTIAVRLVALLPHRPSLKTSLRQRVRRLHARIFRFVATVVRSQAEAPKGVS